MYKIFAFAMKFQINDALLPHQCRNGIVNVLQGKKNNQMVCRVCKHIRITNHTSI